MVMENEIRLGDIMDKLTPSDRVVIFLRGRSKTGRTVPVLRVSRRSVLLQARGTTGGCREKLNRPERIYSAKG